MLRHGESEWNAKNLFTGWVDVDLNDKGVAEAKRGAELLAAEGLLPDVLHTSLLRRAIHTANLALDGCDRHWIPVQRTWRLNERHYGDLQGLNKAETLAKYGEEQFMLWRRSYDTPPPAARDATPSSRQGTIRATPTSRRPSLPADRVPQGRRRPHAALLGESTSSPTSPPARPCSSPPTATRLRALVKHLDGISRRRHRRPQHPHGHPAALRAGRRLRPVTTGGRYLDPDAAAASIEAVKNQGKK